MTRKTFLTYTLIVALGGLSVSAALGWRRHQQPAGQARTAASWKHHFKDAKELVKGSDAVVIARADSVAPGRVAHSEGGDDSLAFEVVNFTVVDGLKGAKDGSTVSIERVSGTQAGAVAYFNFDGGNFEVGGTYLLFLKQQEDGGPYYYQINDQGRFHEEGGQLRAVDPGDPVAALFHGRPVAEGADLVKKNK
ncbi:MAG: hypothetical protein H0V26_08350 [Solirubrobacterales bacterium]|nr:hypothetical protein [Solirubrobacterales bacterium]